MKYGTDLLHLLGKVVTYNGEEWVIISYFQTFTGEEIETVLTLKQPALLNSMYSTVISIFLSELNLTPNTEYVEMFL